MAASAILEVANAHARIERIVSGAGIEGEAGEPVSVSQSRFYCSHLDHALKVRPSGLLPGRHCSLGVGTCGSRHDPAFGSDAAVLQRPLSLSTACRSLTVGDHLVEPASRRQGASSSRYARRGFSWTTCI